MLNLSYVNIFFPDSISILPHLFEIYFSALDAFIIAKDDYLLKIVFKYTYKQIIFFKNTKPSQKFSSIFNSWSIWIYNIGCASWVEGISKSTTLRIQLWVPSYLVSLISRGTRKSLSSWHLPGQIWTWQFICPCRFVGLPM